MRIGQMIIDSELESMELDDSIRREYCAGEVTPAYVLITEEEKYDGLELYVAYIDESGEDVDIVTRYKDRLIALCYAKGGKRVQIPSDSCEYLSFDEREWYILYDTRNNQYVAVKSMLNIPPENILQINQRKWRKEIQNALIDTMTSIILPQESTEW